LVTAVFRSDHSILAAGISSPSHQSSSRKNAPRTGDLLLLAVDPSKTEVPEDVPLVTLTMDDWLELQLMMLIFKLE
jgi:hypothetical protein